MRIVAESRIVGTFLGYAPGWVRRKSMCIESGRAARWSLSVSGTGLMWTAPAPWPRFNAIWAGAGLGLERIEPPRNPFLAPPCGCSECRALVPDEILAGSLTATREGS